MNGLMMHCDLNITSIMRHALSVHAEQEIVTLKSDGITKHRYTYRAAFDRVAQFANSLDRLGISPDAKVGTMAWNTYQHFELHYAIPCTGRIYHTINPKLTHEQLVQIITSAQDEVLIIEPDCLPIVEAIYDDIQPFVKHFILLGDIDESLSSPIDFAFYEALLAQETLHYDWADIPEQTASGLCYTSGTTGVPKGVLYSHRSTVLHAMTLSMVHVMGLNHSSCIMPLVPLYHISAWGMPFNAVLCGAKIVWANAFAGQVGKIYDLITTENVDISMAVPTIWSSLKNYLEQHNIKEICLKRAISGGSSASYALIEAMQSYGVALENAWGMTETSSLGAVNRASDLKGNPQTQSLKCGRPIFGVQMRLKGVNNESVPHDGISEGLLEIRGHSIARQYINADSSKASNNTKPISDSHLWFDTGDIATIDAYGYMHITDRAKDMIKSGGEWVSSIEIENAIMGHHKVAEAAVIAAIHPKWGERPLLIIVAKPTHEPVTHDELAAYLSTRLHKWAIPSATIHVPELPYTGTGKVSKKTLREQFYNFFINEIKH